MFGQESGDENISKTNVVKMKYLVTGNRGFIGYILTHELLKKGHEIIGLDCEYFPRECFGREDAFESAEKIKQITKDLRDVTINDLKGVDVVIHLAALPNDPACDIDPKITEDINYLATLQLAIAAKRAGVKRIIYASSCAVYGVRGDDLITEEHMCVPLTAYAISKLNAEHALRAMDDETFTVVLMRNATCYGVSPRMRFDMVLNNLVGYALTEGKVKLLSLGTSWRPIVHIEDVAQAYILATDAPRKDVAAQTFNIGSEDFIMKQLAEIVRLRAPNSIVEIAQGAQKDPRSYNVCFSKAEKILGFKPKWTAELGARELYEAYKKYGLTKENFQNPEFYAGKYLKKLLQENKIDEYFKFKAQH